MAQIKLNKNTTSIVSPLYLPLTGGVVTGGISATTLSGDGSALTNLTWTNISNTAHEHTWSEISGTAHTHDYLPLTGGTMSGDINMNEYNIDDVSIIQFSLTGADGHDHSEGCIHWNDDDKTLNIDTEQNGVSIQVGQEVMVRGVNGESFTITNGQVVRIEDAQGNRPKFWLASASSIQAAQSTIGIATHDITSGHNGYVTTFGLVREVDTRDFEAGDRLWLSTEAGALTATKPTAPNVAIRMGIALNSTPEGMVFCNINRFPPIQLLQNVSDTPASVDGQALLWDTSTSTYIPQLIELSDLASSAHEHPYLPLTGGIITGGLSATTLSGDGSALIGVSGTDVDYLAWKFDSYEPSGFPRQQRFENAYSADPLSRTFSIGPTASQYHFWSNGIKYVKTGVDSIQWPDTSGLYFFYFDEFGELQITNEFQTNIISKWAYIGNVYWNSSLSSIVFIGDERHGMSMDPATHEYLHRSHGSVYVSGLQLGDFDIAGQSPCFSVTDGVFFDEDLIHTATDGSPQQLSLTAEIPVLSMSGNAIWQKSSVTSWPLVVNPSTNRIVYNEWTGSTWQHTEVTDNWYILMHIFATNDLQEPIMAIMGQTQYKLLTEARKYAVSEISSIVTGDLPMEEGVAIGTVIYHSKASYTNLIKAAVVLTDTGENYVNWTNTTISPGSGPSDHGQLTGLVDDDHTQYWILGAGTSRSSSASLSGLLTVTGDGIIASSISATTLSGDGSSLTNLTWTNISNTAHSHTWSEISNTAHEHTWDEISNTAHDHNETYAPISHTHDYLPLSGGTVTGQTNFTAGLSANSLTANKFHLSQINGTNIFNSVTSYNSAYTNLPIYSGSIRTQQTNEQTLAALNTSFAPQIYCGQINSFNSSVTGFVFGVNEILTDQNYANYNILNTRGVNAGYGSALALFDSAVYGITNVEANGGGAGGQFIINANNNQSPYVPYNSAVKAVFSGATNSGSGCTVGYFGYGYSSNSSTTVTGSAVGVCGYATNAGHAWTVGVVGMPNVSSINDKTWGLVGVGHSGTFGGSLFSGIKTNSSQVHPYYFQQINSNNPIHFTYSDQGCLHVAATAEVLGPMWVDGQFSTSGAIVKGTQAVSTTPYQTTATTHILFVTPVGGGSTITLQTSDCVNGREIIIKDVNGSAGTDNITVGTQGLETIDGSATYTINSNYGKVTLVSNGTNWFTL